jgi:hypothetical protein
VNASRSKERRRPGACRYRHLFPSEEQAMLPQGAAPHAYKQHVENPGDDEVGATSCSSVSAESYLGDVLLRANWPSCHG